VWGGGAEPNQTQLSNEKNLKVQRTVWYVYHALVHIF